ncbi:MAG: GNAT family N-acetyltransferase [Planctomycetota bacterium]
MSELRPVPADAWDNLARGFADHSYRQLSAYSNACNDRFGARSERVALYDDQGTAIAASEVRIKAVPGIGSGLAYASAGPLCRRAEATDEESLDAMRSMLVAMREAYAERRSLILRVQCPLGPEEWNSASQAVLRELGFGPSDYPRAYRTICIDTRPSLDGIRASFHKGWRKMLRRGETRGLEAEVGDGPELFAAATELHRALMDRKGFTVELDAGFYERVQERLVGDDRMTMIVVRSEGEIVGMNLVSALGDTLAGIVGASTATGAKLSGAYLLEWMAIELAHERGLRCYDMGGFDPDDNPGVADFKRRTGGADISSAGPAQFVPSGVRPRIAQSLESAVRRVRRARRERGQRAAENAGEAA